MLSTPEVGIERFSETHWKSLRYFNLYRFAVALLLFCSALLYPSAFPVLTPHQGLQHLMLAGIYLASTALTVILAYRHRQHASMQLTASVMVDVLVMTLLIHVGGGLGSGLGSMLLVTLAGAGLVGQGRLVLFYAAMATLAVLFEQSYRALQNDFDAAGFFHAGVFSAGFFAVAVSARLLARRVIANEVLARQRGVDLNNQTVISQRVIEEMQDGVLVLSSDGQVRQSNPRARQLLALHGGKGISECSPELAQGFVNWCQNPGEEAALVNVPASGIQLRARFIRTVSTENDVLVFLEDIGRLQEQARQIKLAALGRLTANIAHEIRNPLSAISHAGELLREERRGQLYERLLRIVLDNAQRLERIVSDILELGRRDRSYRERIDLREALPLFIEECRVKENLPADVVRLELSGRAILCFDRSHFHQVLWNLLGNALRHSQRAAGSVRLLVCDARADDQLELHVIDDGQGVDEACREQIFEPFFTTHHRGTGLGLFIARELCEANGAQLELQKPGLGPGADFCLLGRAVGC
ncbi:MAG: Sporulation kinase A [Candidatus Accumulibacter phosphatis]|uniref:histidine kinase n=1 Tax=Candidatus Accumulibacter phosphatis TaxID=327160 RepID=A0A080LUG5_9PROT|nr:MAG: Sporulation kinase A [Candidatus Accumulibacter phosphatis]HRF11032.1 ATP-binding protein [Candidatus Accumulibacter phosphatis]